MAGPVVTYMSEAWTLITKGTRILELIEMPLFRTMTGVTLRYHKKVRDIRKKLGMYSMKKEYKTTEQIGGTKWTKQKNIASPLFVYIPSGKGNM